MNKFKGSLDKLKEIVSNTGIDGDWSEMNFGYKFTSNDGAILNWYNTTGTISYQGKATPKQKLIDSINNANSSKEFSSINTYSIDERTSFQPSLPESTNSFQKESRIFIVHGHDESSRTELELFLTKLGLQSFVLQNTSGNGQTIIEALESEIGKKSTYNQFGIVLLTPDDEGYSIQDGETSKRKRARQNAVLEMGMLISALGRKNVAILKKGDIEVPSDADGILYIPYNKSINEVKSKIIQRLDDSGIKLDAKNIVKALS